MLYFLSYAGGPVASALVTDLVPRASLGRGLPLCGATAWLGGITGCVLIGYAAQSVGTMLTLIAVGLLAASRSCQCPENAPGRTVLSRSTTRLAPSVPPSRLYESRSAV